MYRIWRTLLVFGLVLTLAQCKGTSSTTSSTTSEESSGSESTETAGSNGSTAITSDTGSGSGSGSDDGSDDDSTEEEGSSVPEDYVVAGETDADDDSDGYTEEGGDCDDSNAAINPGAEDSFEGSVFTDMNCDDRVELSLSEFSTTFEGETDSDEFGYEVANAGDPNNDGCDDMLFSSYKYSSSTGRVYLVYGRGDGCDYTGDYPALDSGDSGIVIFDGENSSDEFGKAIAGVGDVDGDGCDDFMVGAPSADVPDPSMPTMDNIDAGTAYLIFGREPDTDSTCGFRGDYPSVGSSSPGIQEFEGQSMGLYMGSGVGRAGDVNNDSCADFVIGAYGYDSFNGSAFIVQGHGPDCTLTGTYSTMTAGASVDFDTDGYHFLAPDSVSVFGTNFGYGGDVNGDGTDDLLLNIPTYDSTTGATAYFFGASSSMFDSVVADVLVDGENAGDALGYNVWGGEDINGDGIDDFVTGAYGYNSSSGSIYAFYGATDISSTPALTDAAVSMSGEEESAEFGGEVNLGDFDGDGCAEVFVGERFADNGESVAVGKVHIIKGQGEACESNEDYGSSASDTDVVLTGEETSGYAGYAIAGSGDYNGDGKKDILIGAYNIDVDGVGASVGKVYVVWGHDY